MLFSFSWGLRPVGALVVAFVPVPSVRGDGWCSGIVLVGIVAPVAVFAFPGRVAGLAEPVPAVCVWLNVCLRLYSF